jgi:glutathione peroxidase
VTADGVICITRKAGADKLVVVWYAARTVSPYALIVMWFAAVLSAAEQSAFDFTLTDATGQPYPLLRHSGEVLLVVPIARRCPLVSQLGALQTLQTRWHGQGLTVIAVPVSGFLGMEPGASADIAAYCVNAYGVTFPVMEKCSARGEQAAPLFRWCGGVSWPFEKVLIGRTGQVVARFDPEMAPDSEAMGSAIETALGATPSQLRASR